MCSNCEDEGVGRRDLLKLGAAGIVALGLGGPSWQARAAEGAATTLSPGEALAALKSGNERYVSHPELCSIDLAEQRRAVATHQAPWATIISCADSRVPPELIFGGHGVGELSVARHCDPRHRRIRRRRSRFAAHRGSGPYQLRRSEGGLRRRN